MSNLNLMLNSSSQALYTVADIHTFPILIREIMGIYSGQIATHSPILIDRLLTYYVLINGFLNKYKANIDLLCSMKEWKELSIEIPLLEIGDAATGNSTINYLLATALNKYLTKISEISGMNLNDLNYSIAGPQQLELMKKAEQFIVYNSRHGYRTALHQISNHIINLTDLKIRKEKRIIGYMVFVCPLCILFIMVAIIPSQIIVYRLSTTILYQLCQMPSRFIYSLIEETNKFSEEIQMPLKKLAHIYSSIDFQQERENCYTLSSLQSSNNKLPKAESQLVTSREGDTEILLQANAEDEEAAKQKIKEKTKLFKVYNGRKARVFIIKVFVVLIPIFAYAVSDLAILRSQFQAIFNIMKISKAVFDMDIYSIGSLFIMRENLLLNESLTDDNIDAIDTYLNKSFACEQQLLEMKKEIDMMYKFSDFVSIMNSNRSCEFIVKRLNNFSIVTAESECLNAAHSALEFGYSNAMMYYLRIIQSIKFKMDYLPHTNELLNSYYYGPDLLEAVDFYLEYIKIGSIVIFEKLVENRNTFFSKLINTEALKLVVEIALFIFVFLVLWVNIITSLQHDVNTVKGVLNIFPTKYILPEKSFLFTIKNSFVLR